jgi:hypothetical protein
MIYLFNLAWFIAGAVVAVIIYAGLDVDVIEATVLDVDGVECWFENFPVLSYRVNEQAVDVMITCKIDIINHYLPAIERTQ